MACSRGAAAPACDLPDVGAGGRGHVAQVGEQVGQQVPPLRRQQPCRSEVALVGIGEDQVARMRVVELVDLVALDQDRQVPPACTRPSRVTRSSAQMPTPSTQTAM